MSATTRLKECQVRLGKHTGDKYELLWQWTKQDYILSSHLRPLVEWIMNNERGLDE